ncbi:MAG: adenylate kinase [Clostridiales bacterium]|jgi:adenylate kinase|nr:adenylate kinase [Clostridiales bacterium]
MKLILLGAPGAGKGTQADNISRVYDIPQISSGKILRSEIKRGSELGRKVQDIIEAGQLVPEEIVIALVQERLKDDDCKNGFILDGFPRNLAQAEALDTFASIDVVLELHVTDERIISRISGRRTCPGCDATYHVVNNPPKIEGICDACGEELTVRKDDREEVVRDRLRVYHEQTEPLIAYYKAKGLLKVVEGQDRLEDTTRLTLQALA